jgi:phosphohistidine phosphatase
VATKTILLLRHGHSESDPSLSDAERPLSGAGRRDARRLGSLLVRLELKIDLVVSSTALRARQTAELAAAGTGAGGGSPELRAEPRLFENKAEGYLQVLRGLPAGAACVLLVGHNPAIRQAAAALLGCGPDGLRFAPAALACLEAPADDWGLLQAGSCTLQWLAPPDLAAACRRGGR